MPVRSSGHRDTRWRRQHVAAALLVAMLPASPAPAQTGTPADLTQLSLETLMDMEVTSVSKRPQRLADSAASVYVLTGDDIRRSGVSTIPDALRLVPGLHVGQIDSNKWSVSVRGFSGRFANKLLVMVDGRSVYSPFFSGVFWNLVSTPLDAVDRIEIVRGPGAALWGANAVNGVINIITKSSTVTQGGQLTVSTGTTDLGSTALRYGGALGRTATYRLDVSGLHRSPSNVSAAAQGADRWTVGSGGLRADWHPTTDDEVMFQGGSTLSRARERWLRPALTHPYVAAVDEPSPYQQTYGMGRWTRRRAASATTVQGIVERTSLEEPIVSDDLTTLDLDVQHQHPLTRWNELVVGANSRVSFDTSRDSATARLSPASRRLYLTSTFVQDEIRLRDDRLVVTLGAKVEHNSFTGWQTQPNARVLVGLPSRQSLWAATGRAVRLPSRVESDASLLAMAAGPSADVPLPTEVWLGRNGAPLRVEALETVEGGYRWQPHATVTFDASLFRNHYEHLVTASIDAPVVRLAPTPALVSAIGIQYDGDATVRGAEVVGEWRRSARVALFGGVSRSTVRSDAPPRLVLEPRGAYPETQVHVRGSITPVRRVELDLVARHVSALPERRVDGYTTADARLGVLVGRLDISLIGRNLVSPTHLEFTPDILSTAVTRARRAAQVRVQWHF